MDNKILRVMRMRRLNKLLLAGFLVVLSVVSRAEMQPFPYSSIERQSAAEVPDYRLILSKVSKINGRISIEKSRRLNAQVRSTLYRINDGFPLKEAWNFYQQQLQRQSAEVWYQCHGRECGISAFWANSIFGQAKLGGPDSNQLYGVYHWRSSERSHIAVIYGITRANKRVYIQVDQMTAQVEQQQTGAVTTVVDLPVKGQIPLLIPASLDNNNRLVLTAAARVQVQELAQKLLQMRPERVNFVGHITSNESIDEELQLSKDLARQLMEYMLSLISGLRMEVYGVGSLSPTHPKAGNQSQWVEIYIEN
jgi:outer membrane protein OmpA-like peptidoglycan-associated protein